MKGIHECGEIYFAHLGDHQKNEDKLYDKISKIEFLSEGDQVEFDSTVEMVSRVLSTSCLVNKGL